MTVEVNLNSGYANNGAYTFIAFDFLIINTIGIVAGYTQWSSYYTSPNYSSGFSNTFGVGGTTTFSAGDLILCYIGDYSGGNSNFGGIPIAPTDGEFNVTLYVKYTP